LHKGSAYIELWKGKDLLGYFGLARAWLLWLAITKEEA
jgi:hypothetical protein